MTKSSFSFIPDNFLNDSMIQQFLIFACYIIAIALVPVAFAEYDSPKKQMEMGYPPYAVMCNDGKILAIRDNGNALCLTEKSAQRLGLETISDYQVEKTRSLIQTSESQKQYKELIKESTKEKSSPKNYPQIPSENPEEFQKKFVSALNKATSLVKDGKYVTENGFEFVSHGQYENDELILDYHYDLYSLAKHTMDLMGFNYTDAKITEQQGEKNSRAVYKLNDHSKVYFKAKSPGYGASHPFVQGVDVSFGGWYEDPKAITPKLSGQEAKKIAIDYFEKFVEKHGLDFTTGKSFTIENYDFELHGLDRSDKHYSGYEHRILSDEDFRDYMIRHKVSSSGIPYYSVTVGKIVNEESASLYLDLEDKWIEYTYDKFDHNPQWVDVIMDRNGENLYILS